jgi:HAD superfamily hydrolase (TIGR01548 family)
MDLLIFDMDGVLIDVSQSYRETIQETVQIYLEACLGFEREERRLVTKEDISLFKSAGGFNNDWDLTSGLLFYLLSISGIPPSPKQKRFSSIEEAASYLKRKSSGLHLKMPRPSQKKNLQPFLEKAAASGGGLRGISRTLGVSWNGWIYRSGEINQDNLVKRIFQEVYLGARFRPYYHLARRFYKGPAYYLKERLFIPKEILALLRKKVRMGIASGRPRFEAELALKRFRLSSYFDSVVTLDESEEEETRILRTTGRRVKCSKPHPYPLLRAIEEVGILNPQCGYVGDVVDDIRAAQAAKKRFQLLGIGFTSGEDRTKTMRESLLKAGADHVIESPGDLLKLVR